ncbi:PQQ-dependent dehydrogenase, methanol/ethanol family [Algiphilus sp.]|uniref:PQQ-dependent dehydrogenase, methanol/ethanol family n=1 Tax=Algiphilus sp. TaxID=1872431 RepID=UPI0025C116AA|nr:PQQ-dependent dehydrogenase, methanol/ethanol family [Algiphilus sp.]MCK5769257.1 PQQ-dependent dehydrogenase, methanol/ethanol family [Algiphilus sp.]
MSIRLMMGAAMLCCGAAQAAVDQAALADTADGSNWAAWGRTFDEQRYSPLDQIDRDSVGRLGLAWSRELNDVWNMSSQPLAVDGVIYAAVGYSEVYALDAVSGELLWTYDPEVDPKKMRMAWGIRGLAFWKGRVYVGVQDGRLIAIDAETGKPEWSVLTTEPGDNRYITGAPRVFNDTVIIGHGGADFGHVRGYVTAYDTETGEQRWRWHTVPGNPADGFENEAMAMAAETWTGEWWQFGGGGTVWNAMTYDPEFNRIYIGTGNGSPWNHKLRSPDGGDNLFLCSVVALDADTGEYVWHYQTTPGESWDFNSAMDMVLADLTIDGEPRKALLHAPKNGFFYVLDREDGALISAEKLGKVTWAEGIDPDTGRPVEVPGARYEDGEALIWPGSGGVHNWHPMAFSPDTGLTYIPTREMPGYYNDEGREPKTWKLTSKDPMGLKGFYDDIPASAGSSKLEAWNPVTQTRTWEVETPGVVNGGVIVTAGGLVFQGRADGQLQAHDAGTGEALWAYDMGVGTQAAPMTFSVDGRQYVAILAGWGGSQMLLGSLGAQHGWVGREHPRRLLVFALDGDAELPESPAPGRPEPLPGSDFVVDAAKAEQGKKVFGRLCVICHGTAAIAGGYAPDLRASAVPLSAESFDAIVRDGALLGRGMPDFPELSDAETAALRHYIRQRAEAEPSAWDQVAAVWDFLRLMVKMKLAEYGW